MPFPLAAIAGGLASGAGSAAVGGLLGGGAPTYEPSPLMQALGEYGQQQLIASPTLKKQIRAEARTFGSPGAKEAFLQSYMGTFANPAFLEKTLTRSYKKPIDWEAGPYRSLASQAYGQQGLNMPEEDFQRLVNVAKSTGIRSPSAFSDLTRQDLIASDRVKTPYDIEWEQQFGTMPRDKQGRLLRGKKAYSAQGVKDLASLLLG